MIKVDLHINNGFKWYTKNNISVKGFLFDSDQDYFEKEQLAGYFKNVKTKKELLDKISNANGLFTVLIKNSDIEILFANDNIRSFPLFYTTQNNVLQISDSAYDILKTIQTAELNIPARNELLSSSYVSGSNTLIKELFVTQSGQISQFRHTKLKSDFYFNYYTSLENFLPYEIQKDQLKTELDYAFERLVVSLKGRKAIIPLSGGFDSRFIACKLKELGYKNVLCYSYGKWNDNQERETSQKVAKELRFDWEFVEYDRNIIGDYLNDETFKNFWLNYTQLSSSLMFHDYFALKYFKERSIIPDDSVFISGHSGDFLGGSQLYKNGNIKKEASLEKIAKNILKHRFTLAKQSSTVKKEIFNNIYSQLHNQHQENGLPMAYSIFEDWEIKENLSKYNANSAHIYDFFGYEYRLPFWDKSLVNYCKTIPYNYKFGKILYDDVLRNKFKELDVNFDEGRMLNPKEFKLYKLRKIIKSLIPTRITNHLRPKADPLNYKYAQHNLLDVRK
jgi:asparagine synthase (glutamine-hydrolysing)